MAKVIFTPWKTPSDLLSVRSQFYPPPGYEGPDLRARACAVVSAWKLRGTLPHPIEATALLTDAILNDDGARNSVFAIRATYAAAFCRFVTGLVDSKLGARRSMFSRAAELGLPASFVELRHEATHRELPSLVVLRQAVGRSLEWLWGFYWGSLSSSLAAGVGGGLSFGLGAGVEGVLRGALEEAEALLGEKSGKEDGGNGDGDGPPRKKRRVQRELAGVAGRVVGVLKSEGEGESERPEQEQEQEQAQGDVEIPSENRPAKVLARLMLRDGVLVPSGRRLNDTTPLTNTITAWTPFIHLLTDGSPSFLGTLTESMADALAFPSLSITSKPDSDRKSDPTLEAIYTWLEHILHSAQFELQRRFISLAYIQAVCESAEGSCWTALLKERIEKGVKSKGKGKKGKKSDALPTLSSNGSGSKSGESSNGNYEDEDMKTLSKFGWTMAETATSSWDSRAVAVA
ncbi:Las1-like-domain-containing protein [Aspergillus multicolor]|uniref:rRNA-processing protein LAS1 n=1 Tax=Aspergillus multicolor TaxID=41759 RepID=UPI003CCD3675